ncbi:MAG: zinc-dependent metalloprotease [Ignavibacteriales bacterium]|nr:zinc-dependent metalloprotease [Ignavibacteriales bacterium]
MKTISLLLTVLFFSLSSPILSAERTIAPFTVNAAKTLSFPVIINGKQIPVLVLEINSEELLALKNASQSIRVELPLSEGNIVSLSLEEFDVFAENVRIVAGTDDGDKDVPKPDTKFFKGKITGNNNSFAYLGIVNSRLYAYINDRQHIYLIAQKKNGAPNEYTVFREDDLFPLQTEFECGADELEVPQEILQMPRARKQFHQEITAAPKRVFVALECDYEYFTACGSKLDSAVSYLSNLFGAVNSIYEDEIGVKMRVSYFRIWTTKKDPYGAKKTGKALTEVEKYWNSYMKSVPRLLTHFISGKAIGATSFGGLAYTSRVSIFGNIIDTMPAFAVPSIAYGVSQIQKDGLFPLAVYSWDVNVIAHELGHNFGSPHTHNCFWNPPIDSCVSIEGSCYSGPTIPRKGTIMSYCHQTAGGVELLFGERVKNFIKANVDSFPLLFTGNYFNTTFRTLPAESLASTAAANTTTPTAANVLGEVFHKKRLAAGIVLGVEQPKATQGSFGWLVISKAKALKTFFPQTATPAGFNFFKAKKDPKSAKYNNRLAGELLTAKVNLLASMFGVFPPGLERVKYLDQGNPLHNKTFFYIVNKVDSHMTYYTGLDPSVFINEDSVLRKINNAFVGTLTQTSTDPVEFSAVRDISEIEFLKLDSNALIPEPQFAAKHSLIAEETSLLENYPNPFNPTTTLSFVISTSSLVTLKVYNLLGQEVATLLNDEEREDGLHEIEFNATNLSSGLYYYRVSGTTLDEGKHFSSSKKMMLLK